jgi:TonB-linked outer membrane protein, SusC/RagA family
MHKSEKTFVLAIIYLTLICFIPIGVNARQNEVNVVTQSTTIKGIVVDEKGVPIIGASVKIKESKSGGTITDSNGNFSLSGAKQGSQIIVSFIGYITQTISVKSTESTTKVTLQEDSKVLDEVVCVAYGKQKKKTLTGSITQISADQIADVPAGGLVEALWGQINGLQIGEGSYRPGDRTATMSIRQSFSFSKDGGDSSPLVIIDDIVKSVGALDNLDPTQVESITVLRDAAVAIFGPEASQGAIVVKTKRGKVGPPSVSYTGKFGLDDAVSHPKTLSAFEYGKYANSVIKASTNMRKSDGTYDYSKLYSPEELQTMKGLNYNWIDKAWSAALTENHSLTVSGGSERGTYFVGASVNNQGANLGGQKTNGYSARAGADIDLISGLKLSATLNVSNGTTTKANTKNSSGLSSYGGTQSIADYQLMAFMPKYIPWEITLDDGNTYYTSPFLGPNKFSNASTAAKNNKAAAWNYFALLNSDCRQISKSMSYSTQFDLTYDVPFIKGLSAKVMYAFNRGSGNSESRQLPYDVAICTNNVNQDMHLYNAHPSINDWAIVNNSSKTRIEYGNSSSKSYNAHLTLNYDGHFAKHNISAMALLEKSEGESYSTGLLYNNPITPYNGTSGTAGELDISNTTADKSTSASLSYLGRFTYNWAYRYMFEFVFRTKASNKFAPENYWGFFPGISAAWAISEESWFKKGLPWVNYMKIRASWGKTGKDNVKSWAWRQAYDQAYDKGYQFGSDAGILGYSLYPGKTPNRDVHWDRDDKYNLGLDLEFLDGRLGATVEGYYDHYTDVINKDMASMVGIPFSVGGSYAEENYGVIDAYGLELSLKWRDHIGDFKYNVGVNLDLGLSDNVIRKWPTLPIDQPSYNTCRVGQHRGNLPTWGYQVWRETSTHDGILRTQEDIDRYWAYLSDHASASSTTPSYLGTTSRSSMKLGMLAYKDLNGAFNSNTGKFDAPNGIINSPEDLGIINHSKERGVSMSLSFEWKNLVFKTAMSATWGGYSDLDRAKIYPTTSDNMLWAPEAYWADMYDAEENPFGKYPNAGAGNINDQSDFWNVNTTRFFVKNLSIGYILPKKWIEPIKIRSAKLSLAGNNLFDLYNPYPKHYRNRFNSSTANYPTLRTWALVVNIGF